MWTQTIPHGVGGASALVAGARGEYVVLAGSEPSPCAAPPRIGALGAWRRAASRRFVSRGSGRLGALPITSSVVLHALVFALSAFLTMRPDPDLRPGRPPGHGAEPRVGGARRGPPAHPLEQPPPEEADAAPEVALVVEADRDEAPPPEPEEPVEDLPTDPAFEPAPGFGPPPAHVRVRPEPTPTATPATPAVAQPPARPPAPVAPASVASRPQSAVEHAAGLSGNRPPAYPADARIRGEQGTVRIKIQLDLAGNLVSVRVLRSSAASPSTRRRGPRRSRGGSGPPAGTASRCEPCSSATSSSAPPGVGTGPRFDFAGRAFRASTGTLPPGPCLESGACPALPGSSPPRPPRRARAGRRRCVRVSRSARPRPGGARPARRPEHPVASHLSRGVLAYRHLRCATPDAASRWTSSPRTTPASGRAPTPRPPACRWHATRDPGLRRVPPAGRRARPPLARHRPRGWPSRSVGRLAPGAAPGERIVSSPLGGGLCYRRDPARHARRRDARLVVPPQVRRGPRDPRVRVPQPRSHRAPALGRQDEAARRRSRRVTKYGVLEAKSGFVFENGPYAAIGLATILAGKAVDPCPELDRAWAKLREDGGRRAGRAVHVVRRPHHDGVEPEHGAHGAPGALHRGRAPRAEERRPRAADPARRVARMAERRAPLHVPPLRPRARPGRHGRGSPRQTLTDMPPGEQAMIYVAQRPDGPVVPIWMRPNDTWQWKVESSHVPLEPERAVPDPKRTHTRADWSFAYSRAPPAASSRRGAAAVAVGRRDDAARPYRPSSRRPAATPRKPATRQAPTVVPT